MYIGWSNSQKREKTLCVLYLDSETLPLQTRKVKPMVYVELLCSGLVLVEDTF